MAKEYYLGIDNQQLGPFHKDELLLNGMTEETLVWTEGMSDWLPASDIAELAPLFSGTMPPPGADDFGNFDVSSRFGPPAPTSGYTPLGSRASALEGLPPSSFLGWNIVVTVASALLCCMGIPSLVTGIIGIKKSSKVDRAFLEGSRTVSEVYSRQAKTMFFVSLGLWVLGLVLLIIALNISDDKVIGDAIGSASESSQAEWSISTSDSISSSDSISTLDSIAY